MSCHNSETVSTCILVDCSAKQNESMKLMMVGFQKMGKTTILGRLCESHERVTPSTTFLQRITGEESTPPTRSRGKRTGQQIPFLGFSPNNHSAIFTTTRLVYHQIVLNYLMQFDGTLAKYNHMSLFNYM
jgi:hypothetical protein